MIICMHGKRIDHPCSACRDISNNNLATEPGSFYLGTHKPEWLWRVDFPLFISYRRLKIRNACNLHRSRCKWALDSGGFTELSMYGRWITEPEAYIEQTRIYAQRIGNLDFISPMDWMCEPFMIAKTGLSVIEHQYRTVANYLHLIELGPDLPVMPVLQGWKLEDYLACVDLYHSAGIVLADLPRVGLGSVCRRQSTHEIKEIVSNLSGLGLRLHGFGVKTKGLVKYGSMLYSSDSMAWSYNARRRPPLPECNGHKNCANCLRYASQWRRSLLDTL